MMRPKDKNEEEKRIIEELRKLDNVIKREEKEQKNLETIMKIDMRDDINVTFVPCFESRMMEMKKKRP
jgi:hypothetical protein